MYRLTADYQITPAQQEVVKEILKHFQQNQGRQVLLGVTGSGKTFVAANVIRKLNLPVLVLSPNKSLAAQLYQEFRRFFPHNRVGYFISYYDYYQPEAYLPQKNSYIAKEVQINQEIERLRVRAVRNLLESRFTVVVASVSAIYSFGSPAQFESSRLRIRQEEVYSRDQLLRKLVAIGYRRSSGLITRGHFRVRINDIEVFPPDRDQPLRIHLGPGDVTSLAVFDSITGQPLEEPDSITVYPASSLFQQGRRVRRIVPRVMEELDRRLHYFQQRGETEYAQRLRKRTLYDLDMLQEMGFCPGIENYSMYLSGRNFGDTPYTLLDFFRRDFLTVIDESHITIPQLKAMYRGDRSRKETLVRYGFRLPSALENRPLTYEEFSRRAPLTLSISATPGEEEVRAAGGRTLELLTRPTGLLDPRVELRRRELPVQDMLPDLDREISRRSRVLITTMTKKNAEALTGFLVERGYRVSYLHSEIQALERIKLIRQLRQGRIDILVGINLLREGLDLPEVSLVVILDADAEGYLRSRSALIQTLGRASRHIDGRAILYINRMTPSLKAALRESRRRRTLQKSYNDSRGIIPRPIRSREDPFYDDAFPSEDPSTPLPVFSNREELEARIRGLTAAMKEHAAKLEFSEAIKLREKVEALKNKLITRYWEV